MGGRALGRRRALSGGLASAVAIASGVVAQEVRAARSGCSETIDAADSARETADQDEAERVALHAPFRAAFLAWLSEAADRFAIPVSVEMTGAGFTELHLDSVNPAIGITLNDDWEIIAWVGESDGVAWDHLLWSDAVAEPAPGGVGWVNVLEYDPEARFVHPSREALWRADAFEGLLEWVNGQLAPATHVALWQSRNGGSTWAQLVRDGAVLQTGRPLTTEGVPERLLPVHGWPGVRTAAAETAGRYCNQDGEASMAIGNAVQRGNYVYVYDERGRQLSALPAGSGPEDGLKGYTGATVSVRRGSFIYTYDERGRQVSATPAR